MLSVRHLSFPIAAAALALLPAVGFGQDDALRLRRLFPFGTRTILVAGGGTFEVAVANTGADARDARVVVEYPGRPGDRYARDVWVPPGSVVTTWLPVGPPPGPPAGVSVELHALLYDRTGGRETLQLPPALEDRVRSRLIPYRSRGPVTAVLTDDPTDSPAPDSREGQAAALVLTARTTASLTADFTTLAAGPLPPTPEAFEGTAHVVLAGSRLAADPAGRWALRQWVERGGRLWVMLDLADLDTIAPLLGDDRPLQVVDRVGLNHVRLSRAGENPAGAGREFEHPVDLVRVIPADGDRVFAVANGWPAGFARTLGRGRIVFTTLGAAGWLPAGATPSAAPTGRGGPRQGQPPVSSEIQELAVELHPRAATPSLSPDALRPLLEDEIGYAVMGRGAAAGVLGGFLLAAVGLGVGLRRSRRPELVGWLVPAAAVAAAVVFVGYAEVARRAVPPTAAAAVVAEVVPGTGEVVVTGLFAAYQPESGPAAVSAPRGGLFDLDPEGLEAQTRVRVYTDTDAWHVEGLNLPAGVRTGRFQTVVRPGPITAVARFGPDGVEGRLVAPPGWGTPADALVSTANRQPIAVRLRPDGGFAAGPGNALPPGQYLPGAVLTDRQQRRQAVYRQLLDGPLPPHLDGRDLMLAWTDPGEIPFAGREGGRAVGTTLLVVPVEFERPPPGTRVTIPPAFVAVRRAEPGRVALDGNGPVDMTLRFLPPPSVVPLDVDRAALRLRVRAPGRRVTVGGLADGRPVPLFAAENPTDLIRVDVTDPALLRGDILLTLSIGNPVPGAADGAWRIEELGLELTGRTAGGR